jgi:DNA-binding NarL/FixJ family response regulator
VLLRKGDVQVTAEATHTLYQTRVQNSTDYAGHSEPLTGREEEVLQLLVQGVTTTHELAASLVVSDNTVKFHLRNILDKLHLHNRAAVVAHAIRR